MNKKKICLLLVIFSLVGAYYTRLFFLYTGALITGSFANPLYCLTTSLTALSVLIFIFSTLKHFFVNEVRKKERIVISSISSLISLVGIIFYFVSLPLAFSNLSAGVDSYLVSIFDLVSLIIVLSINVLSFICINKPLKSSSFIKVPLSKIKLTFTILSFIFAFYSLFSFIQSFFVIRNILRFPFGFIVLILIFVSMMYNATNLIINSLNKKKLFNMINLGTNVLVLALFIICEIVHFSFVVEVGKPFCPIDFAVSIPILTIFFLLFTIGFIVYDSLKIIKTK